MNEFESYSISLRMNRVRIQDGVRVFSRVNLRVRDDKKMCWIQDGSVWIQHGTWQNSRWTEFKMAIIKLSQNLVNWIELVWVRVRVEWECFWVNLREDNKVFESQMAVSESDMAEFRMAAIIKLSQNEWVQFFFWTNSRNQSWQVWVSWEEKLRWWIQDGQIQDDCHHQVKWEWMSLSQNELVWVRERINWEFFEMICAKWQCLNPTWQDGWHHQAEWFKMKMAECHHQVSQWEWMSLSESERMTRCLSKMAVSESNMAEWWLPSTRVRMNEWSSFLCRIQDGTVQNGCHSSWVRMIKWSFFLCKMNWR